MNRRLTTIAAFGSFALLGGAFVFQALGYPPCAMCLWQRWPHAVAILIGILAFIIPNRVWPWLGAIAAFTTSGIGFYHSGVEQKWWEGPTTCTGTGGLGDLTGAELLSTDAPQLIMCDVISWQFLGLSMPTWNGILSLGLAFIWLLATRRA